MLMRGWKILLLSGMALSMALLLLTSLPTLAKAEDLSATRSITEDISTDSEPAVNTAGESAIEEPAEEELTEDIGFPQLKTDTYASQVFWLLVSFFILFGLMSKIALPKVGDVLERRKTQKSDDLGQAEKATQEAMKLKKTYEASLAKAQGKAQETLRNAENAIKQSVAEKETLFGEQSRKRLQMTEQKITKAKNDALESLADISADIAADIIHKIAGLTVNKSDAKKAITAVNAKE